MIRLHEMFGTVRMFRPIFLVRPLSLAALGLLCLSGCSADVTRFNLGSQQVASNSPSAQDPNFGSVRSAEQGYAPTQTAEYGYGNRPYNAPPAYGARDNYASGTTRMALAPPPQQNQVTTAAIDHNRVPPATNPYQSQQQARQVAPVYQTQAAPPAQSVEPGEQIIVRSGDTLYRLARQHNVSVAELKSTNGLASNNIRVGQRLSLPAGVSAHPTAVPTKTDYTRPVSPPSNWTGTYEVARGDSLYSIARREGVSISELRRYNRIDNPRALKPGMMLRVPASQTVKSDTVAPIETAAAKSKAPTITRPAIGRPSSASQPKVLNDGRTRVARQSTPNVTTDASRQSSASRSVASGDNKLRWPIRGKIVSGFGPRSDGTHNDGINIAAPVGADVHAAEAGVVAYAGDELKGYGNLILLRHDNGWVTAYAHADEILVKRGDRVKRGQVVAKAGRTGQVDQPQLHFELRQGQKPVDPRPFLAAR